MTDQPVLDDVVNDRLVLDIDGAVAQLVYRRVGHRLILVHTEVPEALGGRGLGGRLVRRAVEKAVAEGLELVPWCPFARRWLQEHAEEAAAVTVDWSPPPDA